MHLNYPRDPFGRLLPAIGAIAKIRSSDNDRGFSVGTVDHGLFRSD
jgi:hypothetical protein